MKIFKTLKSLVFKVFTLVYKKKCIHNFFSIIPEISSRQDDDALTIGEEILQTTTVGTTTTTVTTTPGTLPNGCPLGSSSRSGRLNVETISRRTFSSISLGSVLVLSTATCKLKNNWYFPFYNYFQFRTYMDDTFFQLFNKKNPILKNR